MKSLKLSILCAILASIAPCLTGCGSKDNPERKNEVAGELKSPSPVPYYTPVARYIAGMKQLDTNEFSELEKSPEWQDYASRFDANWTQIDVKRLAPMREWAKSELAEANAVHENVFYPFAGPDFLTAYTFFPHGRNYVFIGLEPPGDVPDLKAMDDRSRRQYFQSSFGALHNLFLQSYFITKEMMSDLRNDSFTGTTPVILIFMARANNEILSVRHVAVDADGKVVEIGEKEAAADPVLRKSRGVKIDFRPNGEREARTLYYFAANLEDDRLKDNPGFVKYLDSLGPVTTFVKSASYLMHYKTFGIVRDTCLRHSNFLLQDDSGIAYRFFDRKTWRIALYGKYTMPIREFQKQYEKDLAKAYRDPGVKKLPFAVGYNTSTGGVNMLLASRQDVRTN
ncbi:MAG TPA: hypothetical protein VFY29_19180 [Terriglobia bacterium]|nr:hypothetical protein [Terriglobia bacterium]